MEMEINRVYWNDSPEIEDIIKKKMIYLDSISSVEESYRNHGHTELTMAWGEAVTVAMPYGEFNNKYRNRIEELDEENRRKDLLG